LALDVVSNEELIREARRRVNQGAWDYLVGGSESETTLRRNRRAFDKIAFRPRVLVDVTHIDPSTTLLGQKLRIPAILAPIGSLQVFDSEAALGSTLAATEFGIMHCVSSVTQPDLEETAAATPTPKIFQLYVFGDEDWTADLIKRVKAAGYVALALTSSSSRISSMRTTPAWEAAARAQPCRRPSATTSAPRATAFRMSPPRWTPPSRTMRACPLTARAISGSVSRLPRPWSIWRPPWFETQM